MCCVILCCIKLLSEIYNKREKEENEQTYLFIEALSAILK